MSSLPILGIGHSYLILGIDFFQVGLSDKISTLVRALSGGMKRKLSLGIALIGNSKVRKKHKDILFCISLNWLSLNMLYLSDHHSR